MLAPNGLVAECTGENIFVVAQRDHPHAAAVGRRARGHHPELGDDDRPRPRLRRAASTTSPAATCTSPRRSSSAAPPPRSARSTRSTTARSRAPARRPWPSPRSTPAPCAARSRSTRTGASSPSERPSVGCIRSGSVHRALDRGCRRSRRCGGSTVERRRRPEKRTAPGALRPEPLRCPGQLSGTNHPPMVDLLALASRSTSHRPSCPKARRAMPRCRPGHRLPGPLPSRRSHAAPDKSEAPIRHREDRRADEPVGVARRSPRPVPPRPTARRTGRPSEVARWHSSRAPAPLTPTLPKRGPGPFSGVRHPKVTSARLGSPVPVGVALSGTEHTLHGRITPGQGLFFNSQGSPQNFPVTHRKRCVHPPFMHSVVHRRRDSVRAATSTSAASRR